jgi:hypothetical protein
VHRTIDIVGERAAEQQWDMIVPPQQMGGSRCGLVPAPSTLVRCQILAFDCPVARACLPRCLCQLSAAKLIAAFQVLRGRYR